MNISLIIVTYNRPGALALILKSIEKQTVLPSEVIIADDGSTDETKILIESFQEKFPVQLQHVSHEDNGFRAATIRNLAVKKSMCDYLIFSDGDLFFHPDFIHDFNKQARSGEAQIGSRVFLTKTATEKRIKTRNPKPARSFSAEIELNRINAVRLPFLNKLLKTPAYSPRLRGGLLGVWKNDLSSVNGWNEAFSGWGFEDTELIARLYHYGITLKKIKFQAITYHLWHSAQNREQAKANLQLLQKTEKEKLSWCNNGLSSPK